jgi:hypothetical protein
MKKATSLLLVAVCASLFSGCTMVQYHKQVVTTLDGNGKVVSTVITEDIKEPHKELPRFASPKEVDLRHISE